MDTIIAEIRLKRGIKANLPTEAPLGEPMWMEDTGELYIGQGEGKAPKLINENVSSLRQAIQTLENNKANRVHTHAVSEVTGLSDTITSLREEDVRLDEKIEQRIEEVIGEISSSSGNTYTDEYVKSGSVSFAVESDKGLFEYPPIRIYKKNKSYRQVYDYEKIYGEDALDEEILYLSGRIYNTKLPVGSVITTAKAHPSKIAGGSYPNGNPYATLVEVGVKDFSSYDTVYNYSAYPSDYGITIYRDNSPSEIDFFGEDIYDEDYNNVLMSAISGRIWLSPSYVDFDNFYAEVILSDNYFVPDNLIAIFSFGLYDLESTSYQEKYVFLEPLSNGEFNAVIFDKAQNAKELITPDFLARFGVKANNLDIINNNYNKSVSVANAVKAVEHFFEMTYDDFEFEYNDLIITFVSNNETVLPAEVAIEDWFNNLHNAYYLVKPSMTDFHHEPITSRRLEMENNGSVNYPDTMPEGDYIPIMFYNLLDPAFIEERDIRYILDVELPPGSNAVLSMFLDYENEERISYDWVKEKFIVIGSDYWGEEGDIPLELLNNLSAEQWNDLFDTVLEYSQLTQSPTSLSVRMFVYTSRGYLEKTNPIRINGLRAEQVYSEWYEEDKNALNTTTNYEMLETNEKIADVRLGYSVYDNYMNYRAIEGTVVRDEYMLQVPYEKYVMTDYFTGGRKIEVRTAEEFFDAMNNLYWNDEIDIKNNIDFQNMNLSNYLDSGYAYNLTINGNGHTFKNIYTNGKGITYEMNDSTVRDLIIENLYSDINENNNRSAFGIFAESANRCTVENVVVKNSTMEVKEGNRNHLYGIGFLFGEASNTNIKNCHIYNSHFKNLYTSFSYSSAGGFVGNGRMLICEKCSFVGGSIRVDNNTGGIAGQASSSKFVDTYVNTDFVYNDYDTLISTSGYNSSALGNFGGFVGYVSNHINLENCYNYSTINGGCPLPNTLRSQSGFGAFVGYIEEWENSFITKLKNCYYGGSGWYNRINEITNQYNIQDGKDIPVDSYKYKNLKLIGNTNETYVGYEDTGLINIIYENCHLLPLNRDQMGDTNLLNFDFENTWQIGSDGLPILKVQANANHFIPETPIRDMKVISYNTETHHVINGSFNVFEVEFDILDLNKITGFCSPSVEGTYSGVFFTDRKLSELKETPEETGQAIKTLSFSKASRGERLLVDSPRVSSLAKVSDFNGTWSRSNVCTGRHFHSVSGFEFKQIITRCMTEFGKQQGDKIYMYISSGMPTDTMSATTTTYVSSMREKYRECVMKFAINEEEKIDYGQSDTKNVLIINSYDGYVFTNEVFELISTLTFNGKILPTVRNPNLFALSLEDIKDCYDLVILSKISPEHYIEYDIETLTNELLDYGIPVINTSSQLAEYVYTPNDSYRITHSVNQTMDSGTNIFGASEAYRQYSSQSYMTILNTTNPIISPLGVTDNAQLQILADTDEYNENGLTFTTISQTLNVGQTLIKDENGNTLLAVLPKGTNGTKADYITYKLLDAPYKALTEYGKEVAKNVINYALTTGSSTGSEIYVYEGDVEYYGEEYLYDDGYIYGGSNNSGGGSSWS